MESFPNDIVDLKEKVPKLFHSLSLSHTFNPPIYWHSRYTREKGGMKVRTSICACLFGECTRIDIVLMPLLVGWLARGECLCASSASGFCNLSLSLSHPLYFVLTRSIDPASVILVHTCPNSYCPNAGSPVAHQHHHNPLIHW